MQFASRLGMHLKVPADAPLVSPPPQVIEDIFISDLCSTNLKGPLPTAQAASQATSDTTPTRSVPRLSETLQNPQQVPWNGKRGNKTPRIVQRETQRPQLGALGAVRDATRPTIEPGPQNTRPLAVKESMDEQSKPRMWFNLLPVVLENIKKYNREQIRQLSLPLCAQCGCSKVKQKAVIRCQHEGCIALDRPLCLVCWKFNHVSVEARKHRGQHTSACPQCQLDWVVYWCAECDLKFCKKCFEQIHSVFATKSHRKIATEDAPGTCLVTSHWSSNFQNVVTHMIASRKQMMNGRTGGGSTGAKRKRDMEKVVIVIDDDDEDEEEAAIQSVQSDSTLINRTGEQLNGSHGSTASQQIESSKEMVNGCIRPSDASYQRRQNAPANPHYQSSTMQNSMTVLIPLLQEPTKTTSIPLTSFLQSTRLAHGTSSTLDDTNTVNVGTNGWSLQRDATTLQSVASSLMRDSDSTNVSDIGVVQETLTSMPTVVDTRSESWSTKSATNVASISNPNDRLPLDNALIDLLVGHYHEMNQKVTNMELQSDHLNRKIALATRQELYSAGPLVTLLSNLQPLLEAAKERRNKLLTAIIIQSNDIMTPVRRLRLAELGDVPQIFTICHRRCLHITNEIDLRKKSLVKLRQQMSDTRNHSRTLDSSGKNSLIRSICANIHMHEKSIKKLQKTREVEFVRIVQFSHSIREALKQAFQRAAAFERQQLQQQQSQVQPS